MDVKQRILAHLPDSVEGVERHGPLEIAELWLLARSYSRLRHRTSPRRHPERRQRFETLKAHCISLAVSRAPDLFLIFVDPSYRHLMVFYHRVERTLLHLPVVEVHRSLENSFATAVMLRLPRFSSIALRNKLRTALTAGIDASPPPVSTV
jgi:hypothetical protein